VKQVTKKPEGEREFLQETSRLEKLAREHSETPVRAQSHLHLAFLYLNYKNPQLNYTRALQEMETYLSLEPAKTQTVDFQNWFAVLREIEKLKTNLEKVQKANKGLRDEVVGLKEMNHKMRETIESLKKLDRQMEEKRSLTK
jgi:outer membrane protein assembly factor BamD (BamD/ComL family)